MLKTLLPRTRALLSAARRHLLPLVVEAAAYFALVYSVALLSQAACKAYASPPPAPKGLETQGYELNCSLAKNVEGALHVEFAVLFERIKEKSAANIDDPVLFVFGHQYKSMLLLEQELTKWQTEKGCKDTA
jgi:hypothetical protein